MCKTLDLMPSTAKKQNKTKPSVGDPRLNEALGEPMFPATQQLPNDQKMKIVSLSY
jgi:hypothetical protein